MLQEFYTTLKPLVYVLCKVYNVYLAAVIPSFTHVLFPSTHYCVIVIWVDERHNKAIVMHSVIDGIV